MQQNQSYVWDGQVQAFLGTVLETRRDRDAEIPEGSILWRAQLGVERRPFFDPCGNEVGDEPVGFTAERMKPLVDRSREGRVNSAGIPALYLASCEQTAVSEVRPWVGSEISVAQFKVLRDLRAIDLSRGYGKSSPVHVTFGARFDKRKLDAATKEKEVWIDIDNAFSRPVTLSEQEDAAKYVPTQILAELFKHAGYDGIIYRSHFGKEGYNVALFNLEDAAIINCAPYEATTVDVQSSQIGNMWYSKSD